jgi:hypothetical protein
MAAMVAVTSLRAGACGSDNNTPTTPTTPTTPVTTTETFTGTLTVNGAITHVFLVGAAGTVTVQLTAIDPSTSPTIGVSIGTWNGTACSVSSGIFNDAAALNAIVTAQVTAATSLCARIYDAGKLTDPLNYTISVVHP